MKIQEIIEKSNREVEQELNNIFVGKEYTIASIDDDDDVRTVKVVDVDYDGDEFVDLILDDSDFTPDREEAIENEFAELTGWDAAGFTEQGMMRKGAFRFCLTGW